MAASKPFNAFVGRWRIVSMSMLEQDFVDEEEEAYIKFGAKERGEFHFCYVHGHMDCCFTTRDGESAVEWSWDGNDEMERANGRGWAIINRDELKGMFFLHDGDATGFVAKKIGVKKKKTRRRPSQRR